MKEQKVLPVLGYEGLQERGDHEYNLLGGKKIVQFISAVIKNSTQCPAHKEKMSD
jgi:hypothetical protein